MKEIRKRPINEYIEAFARCSCWDSKVFHTRRFGQHALVNVSTIVYQVSHFEDLMADYKELFLNDPGGIYTQFPAELWEVFLAEKLAVTSTDLVIDLFCGWKHYWKFHCKWFENSLIYEKAKSKSYRQFNRLITKYNEHPEKLVQAASKIDEWLFLPVIAFAIKMQYPHEDEFYRECVRLMTERFPDQVGDGLILVKAAPEGQADSENQTFFIYTVDEDF